MTDRGVILYGPPASGKDTVAQALHDLDPRFVNFPRLKAGPGRTAGYRMVSDSHISHLASTGEVAWLNERYGARYAVDTRELLSRLSLHIPLLHLGQDAAIPAIKAVTPNALWTVVELWCSRPVARERLLTRQTRDVAARLTAWDETKPLPMADLRIDTGEIPPQEAAALIRDAVTNPPTG